MTICSMGTSSLRYLSPGVETALSDFQIGGVWEGLLCCFVCLLILLAMLLGYRLLLYYYISYSVMPSGSPVHLSS
jgi:hypothetical protein